MNKEYIYLDNAATTGISAEVLNAMMPVMNGIFGNSASIHTYGREAQKLIESARATITEQHLYEI